MVAATQQQHQQATPTAPSAEEEALKRNTDCVYFLASPLTCKKGVECEYRHSEYARVNPRDCYYWLNGNCLNPKCGFRHPPLDGLFGNQATTPTASSMPKPQMAAGPAMHQHPSQTPVKQSVPCHFFQKGLCLKGDRCAFLHGPNPAGDRVSQPVAPSSSTKLPTQPKGYTGPHKLMQDQNIPQASFSKAVEVSAVSKTLPKPEISLKRNGVGVEKNLPPSKSMNNETPKYKATIPHPAVNRTSSRFNHMHQSQAPDDQILQNGKDADEFLRESSPGFDVLVDDELRNSDFYHGEDQYGRTAGQEGRNLNSVDEYDRGHSADYNSVADIDRETYRDLRGYDLHERMQVQYGWEQHRPSSERMPLGPAHLERRGYTKADSPEHNDDPDLRYRLSKHRRVNGLRSAVNQDYVHDNQVEDRGYRSSSRRDPHNVSTRLQGRIKLPGRSSSSSDLRVEREIDRGRSRGRLSPGRSQMSSHQGRLRDRIKGRMGEDYDSEGRSFRDNRMRREMTDEGNTDFAGPKSLAELKGTKGAESTMQPSSLGKRKHLEDHQPFQDDLSFDGPMPLSEILKRKREVEAAGSSGWTSSSNKHDFNKRENKEVLLGNASNAAVTTTESDKDKESKFATAGENTEVDLDQYSSHIPNPDEPEAEYGMEDYQEYEGDDQREADYEYDQVDEGEYYEEGEHVEGEEEYIEEEGEVDGDGSGDGDDFAKKIGVMLS